jgi:hypothetical protein
MVRSSMIGIVVVATLWAACNGRGDAIAPVAPAPALQPAASGPPPPTGAAAPPSQKVTKALVDRYANFEKDHRKITEDWLVANKGHVSLASAIFDLEPKTAELRKKWGITPDEQTAVNGLVGSMSGKRNMWNLMGKSQLAELDKENPVAPPSKPGPNATQIEKDLYARQLDIENLQVQIAAHTRKSLESMRDFTEERATYGSDIVDYVLSKGDALTDYSVWLTQAFEKASKANASASASAH